MLKKKKKKKNSHLDDNNPEQSIIEIKDAAKKLQFQKPQKEFETSLKKLNKDLERVIINKILREYYTINTTVNRNLSRIFQLFTTLKHLWERKI